MLFKTCLMALLPFLIFSYVATGILALRKNAPFILAVILLTVCVSNALVGLAAYSTCWFSLSWLAQQSSTIAQMQSLWTIEPYFAFALPTLMRSEQALLVALGLGIFLTWYPVRTYEIFLTRLKKIIDFCIRKILMPFLPLYVAGFLLKIQAEGLLQQVVGDYSRTFILMFAMHWTFLLIWYLVSQRGNVAAARQRMMGAMPSYMTAMSTMSSTATIPVTLQCAEKNEVHEGLAHVSIPILANIHLLGDAVSVPLLALVTKVIFTGGFPSLIQYFWFLGYFVVSMLAVAGIPGGGIMVMIPVLESMMQFSPDMISLITALYLMQDPFGTAANVMGDGALVMMIERIARRLQLL
jgi:Na+/H+-dicarboxylate symporter